MIAIQDYPAAGDTTRFAFMPGESATQAEMDAFGNGAIDIQSVDTTPQPSPVCFLRGTELATPTGEVPVERLRVGDLVLTADSGAVPVRWIGCTTISWPGADERHKPILIRAGALGPGSPARDLLVSPQHRILLSGLKMPGVPAPDALAPAKWLTDLPGIRQSRGKWNAEYYHLLLDRHEIVISDGAMTESFFPGPNAMRLLSAHQRAEVLRLFSRMRTEPGRDFGPLARTVPPRRLVERLVRELKRSARKSGEQAFERAQATRARLVA